MEEDEACATSSLDLSLSCYDHVRDQENRRRSGTISPSDHDGGGDDFLCLMSGISNSTPLCDVDIPFPMADISFTKEAKKVEAAEDDAGQRKKLKLSTQQISVLEEYFRVNKTLNGKQKQDLGNKLKLRPRQVEVWFQNRRARTKLKQTKAECERLRKCCETLQEENKVLKRDLQMLRERGSHPPTSICPSCEMSGA
ncbi:hypothetical protein MLD38_012990 [Melastoma candidum]|uniref:Uncharacterized protein n=1 Tax=Melastoma candidum TaxID=119954 RepID=A0ACB9RBS1_9MYRT|nr:hypothetical protein MLD38_012990 [Melastoma candidum]